MTANPYPTTTTTGKPRPFGPRRHGRDQKAGYTGWKQREMSPEVTETPSLRTTHTLLICPFYARNPIRHFDCRPRRVSGERPLRNLFNSNRFYGDLKRHLDQKHL